MKQASWHDFDRDADVLDEIDRLRMQEEAARNSLDDARGYIKKLKEALARIAYVDPPDETWEGTPSEALEWAGKIAREALRAAQHDLTLEEWRALGPDAQYALIASGWHPGGCKDFVSDRYQADEPPHNPT